jgi:hypothetical protein
MARLHAVVVVAGRPIPTTTADAITLSSRKYRKIEHWTVCTSDNGRYVNEGSHVSAPTPQNTAGLDLVLGCEPARACAGFGAYRPAGARASGTREFPRR